MSINRLTDLVVKKKSGKQRVRVSQKPAARRGAVADAAPIMVQSEIYMFQSREREHEKERRKNL